MQASAVRLPGWKTMAVGAAVIVLAGMAGFAMLREVAKPRTVEPSAAAAFTGGLAAHQAQSALTPEEEAFAASLWPIHSEVKMAAARMIFAGIEYKTGDRNARTLEATVRPLVLSFNEAAARTRALTPPPALADEHASYLKALDLYAQAAQQMTKVAADGRDEHLVEAQQRSELASIELLKLSDPLWPGEYKPN